VISAIYIEEAIADHPRTRAICQRFASLPHIPIERYGEVFNRKAQNFRLQKHSPALILARKHDNFVLPAPANYGIGGQHNYYFSHMLNCIYDCRYCFLQGMYRSAHYVLFVNYEDFGTALLQQIEQQIAQHANEDSYYFSGYDCDSLALEPISRFTEYFLPLFRQQPRAWLELRTKSTQIRPLLDVEPFPNCVMAFSFTPENVSAALEHKVPALEKRIDAMCKLQQHGWHIGLRFDPLIYAHDYQAHYQRLFQQIFARIDAERLHSVSMGLFRMPEGFYKNITKLYPEEKLFASPFDRKAGMVSYRGDIEESMLQYCEAQLRQFIPENKYFPCY
jgi:spore photoproduct lyase